MAGVLFFDADYSQPVGAAFGWQVEIDDFRELLLQQGNENLVQGYAQHGWLIRWFAGVGAVVDGMATHRDALDGEHGKGGLFVVIAGMVAIRAFERGFSRMDHAFEHDLAGGWNLQIAAKTLHELCFCPAQQTGELVFR